MVAVQVTDKDIENAVMFDLIPHELGLGTLAAIYQVQVAANGKHLRRMKTIGSRNGRRTAKYFEFKVQSCSAKI